MPSSVSEERELTVVNVRLLPKVLSDGPLGGGGPCFRGNPQRTSQGQVIRLCGNASTLLEAVFVTET